MSGLGAGREMTELKNRIEELKSEITLLGPVPVDMPEMIESANLLRKNEYFQKSDSSKSELLSHYDTYVANLETLLKSVFEIQNELKNVLHDQSQLISEGPKTKPKRTTKRKTSKKSS